MSKLSLKFRNRISLWIYLSLCSAVMILGMVKLLSGHQDDYILGRELYYLVACFEVILGVVGFAARTQLFCWTLILSSLFSCWLLQVGLMTTEGSCGCLGRTIELNLIQRKSMLLAGAAVGCFLLANRSNESSVSLPQN